MKHLTALFVLLLLNSGLKADQGLVIINSHHGVEKTMNALEEIVLSKGFQVFARINHAQAAKQVDIHLRPVQLLIFGKPKAGSLLMQEQPSVAIDLPMKYLVWKNSRGQVKIGWNDPAWVASRHHIHNRNKLVARISAVLRRMAERAAH